MRCLENQNQKYGADAADSDDNLKVMMIWAYEKDGADDSDDIKAMVIWASVVWAVGYCYDIREAAAGAK